MRIMQLLQCHHACSSYWESHMIIFLVKRHARSKLNNHGIPSKGGFTTYPGLETAHVRPLR